jgi:TPP-dependent pyruvate/acetoin dehydrogenase alpha subunit
MEQWNDKDPVENYRKYLKENKILTGVWWSFTKRNQTRN